MNDTKKKYTFTGMILLIGSLILYFSTSGKAQEIRDVNFSFQNNKIEVRYKLKKLPWGKRAYVDLYYSSDGGETLIGPLKKVRGDVGEVAFGGRKKLVWDIFSEYEKLEGDVIFKIYAAIEKKEYERDHLLVWQVTETAGIGLLYARVKRWGWFVSARTNGGGEIRTQYSCFSSGQIDSEFPEEYYRIGPSEKRNRYGLTAGGIYRFAFPFYIWFGGGYGNRKVAWHAKFYSYEDDRETRDLWLKSREDSYRGIELTIGLLFRYRRYALSAGLLTINGGFWEMSGGIGLFF